MTQAGQIPVKPREFERWVWDRTAVEPWPRELQDVAVRAILTLKSMDQPAFAKSEVLQRESAKDLQAFAEAYAEWKR